VAIRLKDERTVKRRLFNYDGGLRIVCLKHFEHEQNTDNDIFPSFIANVMNLEDGIAV